MSRFAIATWDELWADGRLLERRLSHGEAVEDDRGISATDARDDALVARCDEMMVLLRRCVAHEFRTRLIAEASSAGATATMAVTAGGRSIITTLEYAAHDLALLRDSATPAVADRPAERLPIVWRQGSGAVLLHEAFGHPLEYGHAASGWPSWLSVDAPLAMRRATFRDVPLLRMTTLVATQNGAPFDLPPESIDVLLVDGGAYDPLTGLVTIDVGAADLVRGRDRQRLRPFRLVESRQAVAESLAGAIGDPQRYPGVVCSREGQELVVGAAAPVMLTVPA